MTEAVQAVEGHDFKKDDKFIITEKTEKNFSIFFRNPQYEMNITS